MVLRRCLILVGLIFNLNLIIFGFSGYGCIYAVIQHYQLEISFTISIMEMWFNLDANTDVNKTYEKSLFITAKSKPLGNSFSILIDQ